MAKDLANFANRVGISPDKQAGFLEELNRINEVIQNKERRRPHAKEFLAIAEAARELMAKIWKLDDEAKSILNELLLVPPTVDNRRCVHRHKFTTSPTLFLMRSLTSEVPV